MDSVIVKVASGVVPCGASLTVSAGDLLYLNPFHEGIDEDAALLEEHGFSLRGSGFVPDEFGDAWHKTFNFGRRSGRVTLSFEGPGKVHILAQIVSFARYAYSKRASFEEAGRSVQKAEEALFQEARALGFLDGSPHNAALAVTANDPVQKFLFYKGIPVAVEWPRGSIRTWEGSDYERRMLCDYGYIRGSEGEDGEELDVYVGHDKASNRVYVIAQLDSDGEFDEYKIMLGCNSRGAAERLYCAHMEPKKLGAMWEMPLSTFKQEILPLLDQSGSGSEQDEEEEVGSVAEESGGDSPDDSSSSSTEDPATENEGEATEKTAAKPTHCSHCGKDVDPGEIFGEEGRWLHRDCVSKGPITASVVVRSGSVVVTAAGTVDVINLADEIATQLAQAYEYAMSDSDDIVKVIEETVHESNYFPLMLKGYKEQVKFSDEYAALRFGDAQVGFLTGFRGGPRGEFQPGRYPGQDRIFIYVWPNIAAITEGEERLIDVKTFHHELRSTISHELHHLADWAYQSSGDRELSTVFPAGQDRRTYEDYRRDPSEQMSWTFDAAHEIWRELGKDWRLPEANADVQRMLGMYVEPFGPTQRKKFLSRVYQELTRLEDMEREQGRIASDSDLHEHSIVVRAQEGTQSLTKAQQQIASKNYKLVPWVVSRYTNVYRDVSAEDMTSVAHSALVRAAQTWNPVKGQFSTHFVWQFRGLLSGLRTNQKRKKRKVDFVQPRSDSKMYGDDVSVIDTIPSFDPTPEQQTELRSLRELGQKFRESLKNPIDQQIWDRVIAADVPITMSDLARELGVSRQSINWREKRLREQARSFVPKAKEPQKTPGDFASRSCKTCGKEFKPSNGSQRYCSLKCKNGERQCAECGKTFVPQNKANPGKFCSSNCHREFSRKNPPKGPGKGSKPGSARKFLPSLAEMHQQHGARKSPGVLQEISNTFRDQLDERRRLIWDARIAPDRPTMTAPQLAEKLGITPDLARTTEQVLRRRIQKELVPQWRGEQAPKKYKPKPPSSTPRSKKPTLSSLESQYGGSRDVSNAFRETLTPAQQTVWDHRIAPDVVTMSMKDVGALFGVGASSVNEMENRLRARIERELVPQWRATSKQASIVVKKAQMMVPEYEANLTAEYYYDHDMLVELRVDQPELFNESGELLNPDEPIPGIFTRLYMPGYLDSTHWEGPFDSMEGARHHWIGENVHPDDGRDLEEIREAAMEGDEEALADWEELAEEFPELAHDLLNYPELNSGVEYNGERYTVFRADQGLVVIAHPFHGELEDEWLGFGQDLQEYRRIPGFEVFSLDDFRAKTKPASNASEFDTRYPGDAFGGGEVDEGLLAVLADWLEESGVEHFIAEGSGEPFHLFHIEEDGQPKKSVVIHHDGAVEGELGDGLRFHLLSWGLSFKQVAERLAAYFSLPAKTLKRFALDTMES